jgi:hypothetical protein
LFPHRGKLVNGFRALDGPEKCFLYSNHISLIGETTC